MDTGLDLEPVATVRRTATTLDVALLFAGANVVSSTLITGATLGEQSSASTALFALLVGCLVGTLPLALLARLGPRTGLPSMVLLRQPFGTLGAAAVSALLILTNFAWIALNNQVAANAFSSLHANGPATEPGSASSSPLAALLVGVVAVAVAAFGPRAMARFDRFAVPLMALVGIALTVVVLRSLLDGGNGKSADLTSNTALAPMAALDLVVGYQVSWALMFADYTRYQRSEAQATRSVFFGLSLTSIWLMGIGLVAGRWVGSNDPAALLVGVGLPGLPLLALALATVTTNFVNIFLSALAVRTLFPSAPALPTVLAVGGIGTALSVADPSLLDRYAGFMGWLATLLLPITAIALVHWFLPRGNASRRRTRAIRALPIEALVAWVTGALCFQLLSGAIASGSRFAQLGGNSGASLPTLAVTALVYVAARRLTDRDADAAA